MRPDFPQIMASVAVRSRSSPAFDHEIATGMPFDLLLPEERAGRKIVRFKK